MAYEMVFLERADLLKYQMYAQLVRLHDQELTVTDIARQMHTKYQATYSVFQEVVADIKDETGLPNKTIRKQLLSPGAKPLSMDAYRARLVERCMLFQLLNYAVQTTNPQLSTFLEAHYVSRSTMTRKLSPCNRFLKHWGLKFRLAQVGFVGPEMSVRYFLFTLYWWAYRGIEWPFSAIRLSDMQAEREALAILGSNYLSRMQDVYFLAVNHLRLSKQFRLPDHRFFTHLNHLIYQEHMRQGTAPATVPASTVAFFNFFQISVPRFDASARRPQRLAQALALLTTPETQLVVDKVATTVGAIRLPTPDPDLRLNLFRLTFGYLLLEAPFPQTQEYLLDGSGDVGDAGLETLLYEALAPMLEASAYADHLDELGGYIHQAADLIAPYLEEVVRAQRVQVQVCVAPTQPGFHQLYEFLNSVPWVASTTNGAGDVVVLDDLSAPPAGLSHHPERVVRWVEGAMDMRCFREVLVHRILDARKQLLAPATCAKLSKSS
mgnify:CR=1 FL=1